MKHEAKVIIKRELAGMYMTYNREVETCLYYIYCFTGHGNKVRHLSMVKLDNYTLQLLMVAHNTVLSQTKEELLQVGILS